MSPTIAKRAEMSIGCAFIAMFTEPDDAAYFLASRSFFDKAENCSASWITRPSSGGMCIALACSLDGQHYIFRELGVLVEVCSLFILWPVLSQSLSTLV